MPVIVGEREGNCRETDCRAGRCRLRHASAFQKLEDQPEEETAEKHLLNHWTRETGQQEPLRGRNTSQGLMEGPGYPPDASGSRTAGD